jgi:hypothetical protein
MSRHTSGASNKSFGVTFAVVFTLVGLWPTAVRGDRPYTWALGLAGLFVAVAFLRPQVLAPLNRVWFRLGMALHHIVNPVLMALIYYVGFVPIGLVLKLRGKDPLQLKRDPTAASYWIRREPAGPSPQSMAKQF